MQAGNTNYLCIIKQMQKFQTRFLEEADKFISKLESNTNSATIDTILKVFKALKADIHFNVTLEKHYVQLV